MTKIKIGLFASEPDSESNMKISKEAEKRGHTVIDIRPSDCLLHISPSENGHDSLYLNGKRVGKNDLDVVIARSGAGANNYSLAVLRHFANIGVPATNQAEPISVAADKFRCAQRLSRKGIAQPRTFFGKRPEDAKLIFSKIGLPTVAKIPNGSLGAGVFLLESKLSANQTLQAVNTMDQDVILQEYHENAVDIRVFIVDGEIVGAMERIRPKGDFRANVSQGGDMKKIKLTDDEQRTALDSAKAVGLGISGVDIFRIPNEKPLVIEVNSSPGLKIAELYPDIPSKIVDYAEKIAKDKGDATRKAENQYTATGNSVWASNLDKNLYEARNPMGKTLYYDYSSGIYYQREPDGYFMQARF